MGTFRAVPHSDKTIEMPSNLPVFGTNRGELFRRAYIVTFADEGRDRLLRVKLSGVFRLLKGGISYAKSVVFMSYDFDVFISGQ